MVVSTYQAASGAGAAAMRELELQTHEVSSFYAFFILFFYALIPVILWAFWFI